jgi:hypothetical protein
MIGATTLRSRVTLLLRKIAREWATESRLQTCKQTKPTKQVGSQYTLPPRSTAVGVISLSAVWGDSFPSIFAYHKPRLEASVCLLCASLTQVSAARFPRIAEFEIHDLRYTKSIHVKRRIGSP